MRSATPAANAATPNPTAPAPTSTAPRRELIEQQGRELEQTLERLKKLHQQWSRQDILGRHAIGQVVLRLENDVKKYGKGAVKKAADALGVGKDWLYDAAKLARAWEEGEVEALVKRAEDREGHARPTLTVSHLIAIANEYDRDRREQLLDAVIDEGMTVQEARQRVRGIAPPPDAPDAPEAAGTGSSSEADTAHEAGNTPDAEPDTADTADTNAAAAAATSARQTASPQPAVVPDNLPRALSRLRNQSGPAVEQAETLNERLTDLLEHHTITDADRPHLEQTLTRFEAVRDAYAAAAEIVRSVLPTPGTPTADAA